MGRLVMEQESRNKSKLPTQGCIIKMIMGDKDEEPSDG